MTQNTKDRVKEITKVIFAERFDMQHLSVWADAIDGAEDSDGYWEMSESSHVDDVIFTVWRTLELIGEKATSSCDEVGALVASDRRAKADLIAKLDAIVCDGTTCDPADAVVVCAVIDAIEDVADPHRILRRAIATCIDTEGRGVLLSVRAILKEAGQ